MLNIFDRVLTNKGIDTVLGATKRFKTGNVYKIVDTQGNAFIYSEFGNLYELITNQGVSIKSMSLSTFIMTLDVLN